METTWREELAWAAGFFDGEGHVGSSQKSERRIDLYMGISQVDRRVLDRFRDAVGCGAVTGPYLPPTSVERGNEQSRYYFQTARFEHIQAILAAMWRFLSPVKREQATQALLAVRGRYTHHQTCPHGHPWTHENIYKYGKYRSCRTCRLEQQKRKRDKRRALAPMPQRDPTVCAKGHALTDDNVYVYDERRMCKSCTMERGKRGRELKRMAAALLEA